MSDSNTRYTPYKRRQTPVNAHARRPIGLHFTHVAYTRARDLAWSVGHVDVQLIQQPTKHDLVYFAAARRRTA